MSNFSPKTYQIYQYDDTNLDQRSYYYNCFTLLEKPVERNVYKISLAQMLYYMFDFGIGYNSKCVTTLTTYQQFSLCRYVNRHDTQNESRPATVADLKKKIEGVVQEMVRRTVKYVSDDNPPKTYLINNKTNKIFPKYLFTLDKELTTLKLKQMTGHDYIEMSDFEDFAYASNNGYSMPKYTDGYVPLSAVRCVPEHDHDPHPNIKDSISYSWKIGLKMEGNGTKKITWGNWTHASNIWLNTHSGGHPDTKVGKVRGATPHNEPASATLSPSWEKPSGVSCFENAEKEPSNVVDANGKKLSIRYHGRRYRLFKRQD